MKQPFWAECYGCLMFIYFSLPYAAISLERYMCEQVLKQMVSTSQWLEVLSKYP